MRDLLGAAVDQNEIVIRLLHCLEQAFDKLRTDPGDIARQADVLCVQRNCEATVNQGGSRTTGHCRGIGLDGALLIDTPTGLQRVVSGTVQPRA
jgi:biotin-(acetyl-CoA carboxylase) ligase